MRDLLNRVTNFFFKENKQMEERQESEHPENMQNQMESEQINQPLQQSEIRSDQSFSNVLEHCPPYIYYIESRFIQTPDHAEPIQYSPEEYNMAFSLSEEKSQKLLPIFHLEFKPKKYILKRKSKQELKKEMKIQKKREKIYMSRNRSNSQKTKQKQGLNQATENKYRTEKSRSMQKNQNLSCYQGDNPQEPNKNKKKDEQKEIFTLRKHQTIQEENLDFNGRIQAEIQFKLTPQEIAEDIAQIQQLLTEQIVENNAQLSLITRNKKKKKQQLIGKDQRKKSFEISLQKHEMN